VKHRPPRVPPARRDVRPRHIEEPTPGHGDQPAAAAFVEGTRPTLIDETRLSAQCSGSAPLGAEGARICVFEGHRRPRLQSQRRQLSSCGGFGGVRYAGNDAPLAARRLACDLGQCRCSVMAPARTAMPLAGGAAELHAAVQLQPTAETSLSAYPNAVALQREWRQVFSHSIFSDKMLLRCSANVF
jgi:hypothetical protein